jgi:hypothetical protein
MTRNPIERSLPVRLAAWPVLARWRLRGPGCMLLCSHWGRRRVGLAEMVAGDRPMAALRMPDARSAALVRSGEDRRVVARGPGLPQSA